MSLVVLFNRINRIVITLKERLVAFTDVILQVYVSYFVSVQWKLKKEVLLETETCNLWKSVINR